jgi:hypothetical protein
MLHVCFYPCVLYPWLLKCQVFGAFFGCNAIYLFHPGSVFDVNKDDILFFNFIVISFFTIFYDVDRESSSVSYEGWAPLFS